MSLIEVDVVRAQAAQRRVDLFRDLLAGQTPVGVGHLSPHLGGQDVGVAGPAGQNLTPRRLGGTLPVDVRGVEEVDSRIERGVGAGP